MLNEREQIICACIMNGEPNKVIAEKIGITYGCVAMALYRVMKKFDAVDKTTLVLKLLSQQLIKNPYDNAIN